MNTALMKTILALPFICMQKTWKTLWGVQGLKWVDKMITDEEYEPLQVKAKVFGEKLQFYNVCNCILQ